MTFSESEIPGCYRIQFPMHSDPRGILVKTMCRTKFAELGLETEFVETFYTVSNENVLRGMHLQLPPADHAKLVYCILGSAMDVCLDLRRGSPCFGRYVIIELSAEHQNAVYLPRGVAHGFYVREAPAIMAYHITSEYDRQSDSGIAWNSFGVEWPTQTPLMSARDSALAPLKDFDSPFQFPNCWAQSRSGREP